MVAKAEGTMDGWVNRRMERRGARLDSCRCWRKKEGRKEVLLRLLGVEKELSGGRWGLWGRKEIRRKWA